MKSREVEAILKRYEFELVSQKGSHRIGARSLADVPSAGSPLKWRNTKLGLQVIVPEHKGKDLPTGTLRNILKGAQIPRSEWKK